MAEQFGYIRENLAAIRDAAERRAAAAGVPVPRLCAVTKSAEDDEVRFLVRECGVSEIAENRTANFLARYALFEEDARPRMHLIGSLQTNKVRSVIGKPALIQSVDRRHLAEEIEKQSAAAGIVSHVLLEINSGREPAKGGAMPEDARALAEEIAAFPHLSLCGVMTMGPITEDAEDVRPCFRETAALFRALSASGLLMPDPVSGAPVLSMGMSSSYPVAVEEGATMIRVGRGLFVKH